MTLFDRGASSAVLSDDGAYRYELARTWGDGPPAGFIMLNPSTADADVDDPTIRRCIGFARRLNCDGLLVANLFGLRATDPRELAEHPDPVGHLNDAHIGRLIVEADVVIVAWGAHPNTSRRVAAVVELAEAAGRVLHCLGKTKAGSPRHPLYLAGDTPLEEWFRP